MTETAKRLAGLSFLTVDGSQMLLRGDAKHSIAELERETVIGQDGVHGFIEKARAAWIEATITDTRGKSLKDFQEMDNVTVVHRLRNGKTIVLHNAWTTTAAEVSAGEASFVVRWETDKGEELAANG